MTIILDRSFVPPATPPSVSYFLEEACAAASARAFTAAVLSYKAALYELLASENLRVSELGNRLNLRLAALKVLIDLMQISSSSVPPVDNVLLAKVQIAFGELLDCLFIKPQRARQTVKCVTAH
jgi:hypothetical protein